MIECEQPIQIISQNTETVDYAARRREMWESTGYIPPMSGGSPRARIDLPIEEIIVLYTEQGWNAEQIAAQFGVSDQTILSRLHEAEVPLRPAAHKTKVTIDIPIEEITHLYRDEGLTIREVAQQLNVGYSTIQNRLVDNEIERRPKGRTTEQLSPQKIRHLYENEGKSAQQIAQLYNCHQTTILDVLRQEGVEIKIRGKKIELPLEDIAQMYINGGMSMREIAEHFEVATETIRRRLHQVGIDINK